MSGIEKAWYGKPGGFSLLLPFSWLYRLVAAIRKSFQQARYQGKDWPVPVVVIGNISVGGTGKTPLLIALTKSLAARGIKPGVVSRGYGGSAGASPLTVNASTSVRQAGDEALLIARRANCPVVVCSDRRAAVDKLLNENQVDIILSDDGLQHYRMHRDMEVVVIDKQRGLGNGYCLPVGPLRETAGRLHSVDAVVINGADEDDAGVCMAGLSDSPVKAYGMELKPTVLVNLVSGEKQEASSWSGREVHGVAGIGNPARFEATLNELNLKPRFRAFPDHHNFSVADLAFDDDLPIIMTGKDAVKCESFASEHCWYLDVEAEIPEELVCIIGNKIDQKIDVRY
ncbi:MAG TPA: tetraacyldisaccharide 4'-kinase [Porticoccaceae bacterium]|nr:tetraacyldisaccharide 4'-kinase [Porticoccaceae bacterium]